MGAPPTPEREDMNMLKMCKEQGCLKKVAGGQSIKSYAARSLGYCLRHYLDRFPTPPIKRRKRPVCRQGNQMILSWSERIRLEKVGFNQSEWSPEFRKEMREYWKARMKGELL
jgi:hypothetical protein